MFETYEKIDITDVGVTSEISKLVGKRLGTLPVENGIRIEAYYALQLEYSIISAKMLSSTFDITSSYHRKGYNA